MREWTAREDALICKLRQGGASNSDIATHFPDRTREAVKRRIRILIREGRLERQRAPREFGNLPWTRRDEALLMRLRARDATLEELCERLPQRTRAAIVSRIHELMDAGVIEKGRWAPRSHRRWSREEDELVALMRRAGRTMEEMAAALDRSLASINNRIADRVRKGELELLRELPPNRAVKR